MNVQGKHVLVVGLARSGLAVARALVRRGAVVTVLDRKPPVEFREIIPELLKDKVGMELGSQSVETFLRQELIVVSPGVPWDLPQLQAAREKKIPIYPEVEAAAWFLQGTMVGVTGSNGKTTTTSLLGEMLKASGLPTFVGGNIGNALSLAVDHAPSGTRYVTELSSFQLEGIHEFHPHVAVILNLSPNHLDRHPSLEAYAQAKRQIFRNQGEGDYAVLNADDAWVAGLQAEVPSRPVLFSRRRELADGVFVSGGKIYYRVRHLERVLFDTRDVTLRGDFNLEDVLAATTAACLLGADFAAIRKAVRSFKAVEHRLEFVREIRGVDFYNNSKATSVDATLKSLGAFERGVHLIMGGKDKGAPYTPLLPLIKDRVRDVLLIGAAAPVIAQQLAGSVELIQAGDLASAVYEAFARSRPGDTVLLAPACSSFDQFKDYEERGRVFKELVLRLEKDARRLGAGYGATRSTSKGTRDAGKGQGTTVDSGKGARDAESGTSDSHMTQSVASAPAAPKSMNSELRIPDSEASAPPAAITAPKAGDSGFRIADSEASVPPVAVPAPKAGDSGSRIADSEASAPPAAVPAPHAGDSGSWTPESGIMNSESRVPLTYVYEVDAVESAEVESQVVPDDEPSISISEDAVETVEDESLPFEARPKGNREAQEQLASASTKSVARARNGEVQSGGAAAQPVPEQPKLFNGHEQ